MLSTTPSLDVRTLQGRDLAARLPRLEAYARRQGTLALSRHPGWLAVLEHGLGHTVYCLEVVEGDEVRGFLPLAFVKSLLFGRFLVSLPYLNSGGALAEDETVKTALIDRAVGLADELNVRYLELRHEAAVEHPRLGERMTHKVHMRLPLPAKADQLWTGLDAKVRNQVRKGQKSGLQVFWGGADLLPEFYAVFSHNMRDLGTPVYGRGLFRAIVKQFADKAEFCVVRAGQKPAAAALLLHGWGATEVPSASALRQYNPSCANMLMYWHLLERAIARGQSVFDFGRSSADSPTYRFKKQWGAKPAEANWQYFVRQGAINAARPDNPRYGRMIRVWQRLPVALTRLIGPPIVRGIP
jgi:FemAB-related protein (PEP-CTERM system-associated)